MSYNQLFTIETCTQVNVREATRGQAVQRKLPGSGLQGDFCKNCCTRVFTSAIPRPWHQPFLSLSPAENGNYVAERAARYWCGDKAKRIATCRAKRTELTPGRLFPVCEAYSRREQPERAASWRWQPECKSAWTESATDGSCAERRSIAAGCGSAAREAEAGE